MGKRYYCDFCDKSFADNQASKRNHFNGALHQRMRKVHYDSFKDPMLVLSEEAAKRPCRSFLQTGLEKVSPSSKKLNRKTKTATTGFCDFGDNCRFSHLTEENKHHLEEECLKRKHASFGSELNKDTFNEIGSLDDWLVRQAEIAAKCPAPKQRTFPKHSLPPFLTELSSIPPSLLPPTKDDVVNLPLLEWG